MIFQLNTFCKLFCNVILLVVHLIGTKFSPVTCMIYPGAFEPVSPEAVQNLSVGAQKSSIA